MPDIFDVLELVKREDRGSDVDVVDLRDWLKIPDGWIASADDSDGPIDEVLTLNIDESDIDSLAGVLQDIDLKIKEIDNARRTNEIWGVWLRAQLAGETNPRQAYLLRGRRGRQVRVSSPAMLSSMLLQYPLGLTRLAWETTTGQTIPESPLEVTAHGGAIPYSIAGDVDGRIALAEIIGGTGTACNEIWLGVKSEQYNNVNPDNFVPFWGIDKRTWTRGDDATEETDANAVCGDHLKLDITTPDVLLNQFAIDVNSVTPYIADQRGKYVVLVRCYTSDASTEIELRLGQGYTYGTTVNFDSMSYGERVLVGPNANNGYGYYSLGTFDLPPFPSLTDIDMDLAAFLLQAEKTEGSGSLYVDGFLLIPAEHFVHVSSTVGFSDSVYTLYLITTPDRRYRCVTTMVIDGNEFINGQDSVDQLTWLLPSGAGSIICCASNNPGVSDLSDTVIPTFTVYPSFSTLRGAS